jgi:hypothetical protein
MIRLSTAEMIPIGIGAPVENDQPGVLRRAVPKSASPTLPQVASQRK